MYIFSIDTQRLYTVATQNVFEEFKKQYTWDIKKSILRRPEKPVQTDRLARTSAHMHKVWI